VVVRKVEVELGVPYTGWPLRAGPDYEFGQQTLSPALKEALVGWAAEFNREFDDETGWSSDETRRTHQETGERLRDEIQDLLGDSFAVTLNPLGAGSLPPEDVPPRS